jgi:TatD DNase family protein
VIIPAIDVATSSETIALTVHDGVFASVGIHPTSTADFTPAMIDELRALAVSSPRVVAIGEIGLDYYWDRSPRDQQQRAFEAQLRLAAELHLPVIIHNRDAHSDIIAILEAYSATLNPADRLRIGVMHSFSAPLDIAQRALKAGFHLGFTGPLTFKNADDLRAIAAQVSLDRLLVETDGPFLTPAPHRGQRNEPAYIPFINERLAALHQITPEAMAQHTTSNAERLFGLESVRLD